jgi:hypothetical protein
MAPGGHAPTPLVCPSCGRSYPGEERFCDDCRLPLVHDLMQVQEPPLTEARERARKIKPQLAEGKLVRVVTARNLTEAEFIQGMLLEEGIPSMERRSAGFDVPDFLAAGPRDILVPQSGLATAREVLLQADVIRPPSGDAPARVVLPGRLAAGMLGAFALAVLIVWLLFDVVR